MKHRKLSLSTLLLTLLGWCVCPQLWADKVEVDGIYYNINGTIATVTYPINSTPTESEGNPYTGDIVIPQSITTGGIVCTVTAIGDSAFAYSTITSIQLPNTITSLGRLSIASTKITTITIPDNVTTLNYDCLSRNENMATVYVGASVNNLHQGVFYQSKIKDVYFTCPLPKDRAGYLFTSSPTLHTYPIYFKDYKSSNIAGYMSALRCDMARDYTLEELNKTITDFGSEQLILKDAPGYYTVASATAYNDKINEAKTVASAASATQEQINTAVNGIANAYLSLAVTPLTEGYYAIICDNSKIAANGKEEKAMYINSVDNKVYWGKYEENNAKFIFKITSNGDKWNIQSSENDLYVNGAKGFCNAFDAAATPTSTTIFNFYPGTGSCYIKNVLDAEENKAFWTMCPQGNAEGTSDGPSTVFAYNGETLSGGNVAYAEWTWQLRPVKLSVDIKLASLLENKKAIEPSEDPNRYCESDKLNSYNKTISDAQKALASGTVEEKEAACTALEALTLDQTPNTITEGYYYITSAGNGPGHSGGPYNYEDKNALYNDGGIVKWKAFDRNEPSQVYYFFEGSDGWYAFNPITRTYINKGTGSYACNVVTSASATTTQKFVPIVDGSGKFAMYSVTYAYSLADSHNGSANAEGNLRIWGNTTEARSYGVNQWFIHKVSQDYVNQNAFNNIIAAEKSKIALESYKAALTTYKTSIQDGDYYAGTDNNHGLKSHYFVDGTERTSQKGYECTQEQIDAFGNAIAHLEEVLNSTASTETDINEAVQAAEAAKAVCDKKWAPLTDGIYFIINGFADDAPNAAQALKYGEDGEKLYKRPLVNTEPKQMFEVKVLTWETDADGCNIPTSATIKNIASGKYLGGVADGKNVFSDTPVTITWPEKNTQGSTKQAHRFQLQTPTGEKFNGNNNSGGCEVTTSGGYPWNRSWMFRPADKYYQEYLDNKAYNDYKNTVLAALATPTAKQDADLGSNTWIDGTERTAVAGVETTQERLDALQTAWNEYDADRTEANKAAVDAAMAQVNKKWEPLTTGIYFLIPRYGDDQGNKNTLAMTYQDNAAWKKPLVELSPAFMFEVTVKSTTTDAELGEVPQTLTIKNMATGKYLGKMNGTAWEYQDNEAVWNYTTFVGNDFFSSTKHAHCFGLNINDQFITYGTNNTGTALTTTSTSAYAWKRAWMFRPADKYYQEYISDPEIAQLSEILSSANNTINSAITPADHHDNTGNRSFLLGNEKTSIDGLATSKEALDALKAAYAVVDNAFKGGKKLSQLTAEVKALTDAQAVVEAKSNPLTSGFYQIIAEYGDDTNNVPGGFALQYGCNTDNPDAAYKRPYEAGNLDQIFYVDYDKANGKITLRNANSGKYLGKLNDKGKWEFTTERTSLNITTGSPFYWYHNAEKTKAARSCSFVMTDDNANSMQCSTGKAYQIGNIASVNEGTSAWMVAWAFRPVDPAIIPETTVADGKATVNYEGEMTTQVYALAKATLVDDGITSIDLTGLQLDGLTPNDITIPSVSKNAVYYLPDTYTQEAGNFIIGGTCAQLVLTDKADFAPATPFTATAASYSKTGLDGKGWYTAVLPYAINVPEGMTALGNAVVNGSEIRFDQINAGEIIAANTPFIYKTAAETVTFEASNANITAEPQTNGQLKGTYTMIPAGEATGKLIINADGTAFATATDQAYIPAFRAFLDPVVGSNTFTIVINNDLTGIGSGDAINGQTALVDVCTMDGKVVRKQVDAMTALQGLPNGIYIVNGIKIKK